MKQRKMEQSAVKQHIIKELFITFFKIGAFTFGGGYAMLPLIKREAVEEKGWLEEEEMLNMVAIAESTPGPLAINTATFVGSRMAGTMGAIFATVGVVLPSFLMIVLVSRVLLQLEHFSLVQNAFMGIRAGVLVLIGNAVISMFKKVDKQPYSYLIMGGVLAAVLIFKVKTIPILAVCVFLGILHGWRVEKKVKL